MQHLRRFFYKTIVIENGFVAVFVLIIVLGGGVWAAVHFSREDTSPLTNEIARLQNANAALASKNQELQTLAGDKQAERNQLALIPQYKAERDAAIAERDQATDFLRRLRADTTEMQRRIDQLQQDNHKIKGELDTAIAERDQLSQSLAAGRTTTPTTQAGGSIPRAASHIRDWLPVDAVRIASAAVTPVGGFVVLSFTIENHSHVGFGIALRRGGSSAGPCSGQDIQASGLELIDENEIKGLGKDQKFTQPMTWLASGAKIHATIRTVCYENLFDGLQSVPLSVTPVLVSGDEVIISPLSTPSASVDRRKRYPIPARRARR